MPRTAVNSSKSRSRSRGTPTQAQAPILELLNAFEYLTTQQLCDYMALTTGKRALERKLQRLVQSGFIGCEKLNPEKGAASERCWLLLQKGAEAIGVEYEQRLSPAQKGAATPKQKEVLYLLADAKGLLTSQIWMYLHRERPRWHTQQLLYALRERGYVRSYPLYPERGAASEFYWVITGKGASAIDVPYDARYRRRPTRERLHWRGVLLEVQRQVAEAGWSLIVPVVPSHSPFGEQVNRATLTPENKEVAGPPQDTPQRRKLVEAVLREEWLAIERLLMQGYPASRLQDRIDRVERGLVGAVVPRNSNDYVAYTSIGSEHEKPDRTVLLIPHPPFMGRGFWRRKEGSGKERHSFTLGGPKSRLEKYERLAKVMPVVAVFSSREEGRQYEEMLGR